MRTIELFKLWGSILIDNEKANASIGKTEEKAQGLASKLGSGIATAAKWGAAITGAATVVGGAMFAAANKTAAYADEIDKLSERTGINREELQRWKYAAGQSGADIGKLEVGIKKLSESMVLAGEGSKKNVEGFNKLNISLDDLKNKSQEDIFAEVMKSLADMPAGAERNALGNQLLGKSYTELLPLLNAGSGGMEDLMKRADELGIVMSEDMVKANVKYGDTVDDAKQVLGAFGMQITNGFLPILQQILDWVMDHLPEIQAFFEIAFAAISFVIENVWKILSKNLFPVLKALYDWVKPYIPAIQRIIEGAFAAIGIAIDAVTAPILAVIDLFQRAKAAAESFFSSAGSGPIIDDMTGETISLDGARANGGPVSAGRSYLVGERGPEVFTPSTGGSIAANDGTGAYGVINVTQNIYAPVGSERALARATERNLRKILVTT